MPNRSDVREFDFMQPPNIPEEVIEHFEKNGELPGERVVELMQTADRKATYVAIRAIVLNPGSADFQDEGPDPGSYMWILADKKVGGKGHLESPCHNNPDAKREKMLGEIKLAFMAGGKESRNIYNDLLKKESAATTLCVEAHIGPDGIYESYGLVLRTVHQLPREEDSITYLTDRIDTGLLLPKQSTDEHLQHAMDVLFEKLVNRIGIDMSGYFEDDTTTQLDMPPDALTRRPEVNLTTDYTQKFLPPSRQPNTEEVINLIASTAPQPESTTPPMDRDKRHALAVERFASQHPFSAALRRMTGRL